MIIIDSIYINSYGGKILLNYFIDSLRKKKDLKNFLFFFDDRLLLDFDISGINFLKVRPNHFSRRDAYLKNIKKAKKVFCLSNIPPPLSLKCSVYIYFHNLLFLKWNTWIHFIKFLYILLYNKTTYNWIVQTNYTKNLLSRRIKLKNKNILVLPFFKTDDIKFRFKDFKSEKLNFIYPTSNNKHKNLKSIVNAFLEAKTKLNLKLYVTIKGENIKKNNKEVLFTGILDRDRLLLIYDKSHFLILPSKLESFGLPIIEAIKSGSKILVSDLPTFKEICKPTYLFEPENIKEIRKAVEMACQNNNKEMPKLRVKDGINDLINLIC